MRVPALLKRLQAGVRRAIPSNVLEKDTYVHHSEIALLRTSYRIEHGRRAGTPNVDTETFRSRLIKDVVPFIRAIWPDVERGRKWTNTRYCPKTAIGSYLWLYQVTMVQELLWMRPAFVAGFRYATSGGRELDRDMNPYAYADSLHSSWDSGYILGLAVQHPKGDGCRGDINSWLKWLESDAALPGAA